MAYYNNGFPMNYQPYYQTPNYQQTPQQQQIQGNGIVWVSGEAGAKAYLVAPNASVPLWDSEANVIYIKTADASGMPSMKILDYTVRDNGDMRAKTADKTDFATKDDILHIQHEIDGLKAKIEGEDNE